MSKNEGHNDHNEQEKNPFSLPGDYFSSFSKKMLHRIELADEIKEFEILSSIDKRVPFVTPENYFQQALSKAVVRDELSAYKQLSSLEKANSFATPEAYFENLASSIKSRTELSDELKAYPGLYVLDKENNFAVPENYFENVSHRLQEKIFAGSEEKSFGKVLQLVFSRKTVYALAAMLVLSLGLWYFTQPKETVSAGDCQTLACLEKNDIHESQLYRMDEESLMEAVNADKLSKNLQKSLNESAAEKDSDKKEKEDYVIENTDVNDIVDGI